MGVDAQMFVRLAGPISEQDLCEAAYRLAEAVKADAFYLSNTESSINIWGPNLRALNRVTEDDTHYEPVDSSDRWLRVSLRGRYYGQGYERGNLWTYVAVARWLLGNLRGCAVFYGGDSGDSLDEWTPVFEHALIQHWTLHGARPYYQSGWARSAPVPVPVCPLCQQPATQYGSGAQFASWSCDGCGQHWVWAGQSVKRYDADGYGKPFDSFKAAKELRDSENTPEVVG